MKSYSIMAAALFAATTALGTATVTSKGVEEPSSAPMLGAPVVQGCFSDPGELKFLSTETFNSKDRCGSVLCKARGKAVAGTMGGNQCFCGDKYPPKAALANDTDCNIGCSGFDQQACGGSFFWTIYNTGLTLAVRYSSDDILSSTSTSKPTPVVTETGGVVTVTGSESPSSKPSGGPNTAGIAAGVVVSVVVVGAIIAGVFFMLRRRRNREIEEEHRRNASVNAFISSSKPPSSSGGYSVTDSRLDPVMAQRRVSNGSIADNQDYSRRILRVTNA